LLVLLSSGLVGCSKQNKGADVSGKVVYKGQAVNGGKLHFHPAAGPDILVSIGQDGTYRAVGLPRGDMKVTVEASKGVPGPEEMQGYDPKKKEKMPAGAQMPRAIPPTIVFPDKYKDVKSTDLTCKVTTAKQTVNFELKD
jgi:hypothetical protein